MNKSQLIQSQLLSLIYSEEFKNVHRLNKTFFTRQTPLSFANVIGLIIQKMTKSLQIEANLLGDLLKQKPVSKQALSTARYKIGVSAFQELHQTTLAIYYENNKEDLWKGYRVFGGDGSTLQLPRRGDIPSYFGDHFKRTCLARVMQYTELTSDLIVAADLKPYCYSEEQMSKNMLPDLVRDMKAYGQTKQLYVYDRGFPSHAFAQRHLNLGVDFLFRVQKTFTNEIKNYVSCGEEASFERLICKGKISYTVRCIIRYLKSGEPLVLLTSLLNREEFTDEELIDLYRQRWRCEESYKFQKTILQLDNNYCRSTLGTMQEFWSTVLLATLMGIQFNEEDKEYLSENPGKPSKANRSVIFGSLKRKYLAVLLLEISKEDFNMNFKYLCRRHRVPDRPHRSYERLSVDTRKTRHCYRRVM